LLQATGPGVETFPRENRSAEESSWQPRKKQKRRNINRPARRRLAKPRNLTGLSGEAPLERLFLFLPASTNFAITAPSDVSQYTGPHTGFDGNERKEEKCE
jgi:hypothetical protein